MIDTQNQPVEGARLIVAEWRSRNILDWKAKSDAHGRFVWENAPKDPFTLSVFWQIGQKPVAAGSAPTMVVIRVKPELKLEGTVVDATTGRPVERFRMIRGFTEDHPRGVRPRLPDEPRTPAMAIRRSPDLRQRPLRGRFRPL